MVDGGLKIANLVDDVIDQGSGSQNDGFALHVPGEPAASAQVYQ